MIRKRSHGKKDPVRSDTDLDVRVRRDRSEKMLEKYEKAEKLVEKQLALNCEKVEALRGDTDWLTKITPYLGTMPDSWMAEYLGVSLSVIKRLRERNGIGRYNEDEMLEKAMSRLEKGKTGLAEQFKDVDLAKIARLFGVKFSQSARSADAV